MTTPVLSLREANYLAMLAGRHPRATAAAAAGLTTAEAHRLAMRCRLRFNDSDRLRDPVSVVVVLVRALRQTLEALATARGEAEAAQRAAATARGISATTVGVDASDVRAWAAAQGLPVRASGRLTRDVLTAYHATHPGSTP